MIPENKNASARNYPQKTGWGRAERPGNRRFYCRIDQWTGDGCAGGRFCDGGVFPGNDHAGARFFNQIYDAFR